MKFRQCIPIMLFDVLACDICITGRNLGDELFEQPLPRRTYKPLGVAAELETSLPVKGRLQVGDVYVRKI